MFYVKANPRMTIHQNLPHVVLCDCGEWYCLKCEKHLADCPCNTQD